MANNLFISYDLMKPGQNYEAVIEKIKGLGSWAKVHYSLFYVSSKYSARQATDHVWAAMDANDTILVVNASTNEAAWQNLGEDVSKYIREHW
jgi:hypothetical protein